MIPIFYVRGYDPPYTEGHIAVVRGMVKSLLLDNTRSVVFNYKYDIGFQDYVKSLKNGRNDGEVKFEQYIPLISREDIFHQSVKLKIAFSSLMETLATPRFLFIERYMNRQGQGIVNLINCFKSPRIFAKKFSSSPVVLHVYTRKIMIKNSMKLLIDKADLVITSSKSLACYLEEEYDIDRQKIETIYPPVDTEVYKPNDKGQSRLKLGLEESSKFLLYLGNLRKNRFPENVILPLMEKLVKNDPKIKLLIFSPKSHENIERMKEILAKVSVRGNLLQNIEVNVRNLSEIEKIMVYSASDLFLFPPLKSGEAVEPPITLLEAMSCGLPVVSSDVASITEVITDKADGLIVPFGTGDHWILEEQVTSLLEDHHLNMKFSDNARQNVIGKFSLRISCKRLMRMFRSLSDSNSPR